MPSVSLWGTRWHFSTDIVPLPASIAFFYHFSWFLVLLVGAAATGEWPGHCESWEGVHYVILFSCYFGSFSAASLIDALLFWNGLQGAPFEEKKRRFVIPLLYVGTVPFLVQLGATCYGSWAAVGVEPDCWPIEQRNAITNFAQALVFINWAYFLFALYVSFQFFYLFLLKEEINTHTLSPSSPLPTAADWASPYFTTCIQICISERRGNNDARASPPSSVAGNN